MAKKLNKLAARGAALEKAVAAFSTSEPKARRKTKKAKPAKKANAAKKAVRPRKAAKRGVSVAKKRNAAKRPAAKKDVPQPKPAPAKKAKKRAGRKTSRVAPPTPEQLTPSGVPEFTTPTS